MSFPDILPIDWHPPLQPPDTTGWQRARGADAYIATHTLSSREPETLIGIDLLPRLDAEALKQAVASEVWVRS